MSVAGWPPEWFLLAGLTLLSGSITVKLPSVPATISVSETFVFTSALLFGPAAGTVTVALDGLVISLWLRKKQRESFRAAFNVAAPAISIWVSSHLFFRLAGTPPLSVHSPESMTALLFPLAAFTSLYFLLNSWLIALAIGLERATSALKVWRDNFFWLGLNYFGGASVAALLVASSNRIDWTTLGIIVPLLVISYLTYKTAMGRLEDATTHLSQLNLLYVSTIETLAKAIDARDQITHDHIRRVQVSAVALAKRLGVTDEPLLRAIEAAALLHDLGKLRIPEQILNKPGRLTESEFERVKTHSKVGADILSSINFPYPVVPIVRHHHESWDGTGYPDKLSGTDIPIGARILAVVDCFDALTSDRPYRPALDDHMALRILLERRGTMYDPLVVDAFVGIQQELGGTPASDSASTAVGEHASSLPGGVAAIGVDGRAAPAETNAEVSDQVSKPSISDVETSRRSLCELGHELATLPDVALVLMLIYDSERDQVSLLRWFGAFPPRSVIEGGAPLLVSRWVGANQQDISNASAALEFGPSEDNTRLVSCMAWPVTCASPLVGVISLYSDRPAPFALRHRNTLQSIAPRLFGPDSISTQQPGTRHLIEEAPDEHPSRMVLEAAGPVLGGSPRWSVLLVRLTEDQNGRVQGQLVLDWLDSLLKTNLRSGDFVLRLQHEGIAACLLHADEETAERIARRVLETALSCACDGGPWRIQALHIAHATCPEDGATLPELLAAARSRQRTIAQIAHEDGGTTIH